MHKRTKGLYERMLGYLFKFVAVLLVFGIAFLAMDRSMSEEQLIAYADESDDTYKATKMQFAEAYKVQYVETEVDDTEESSGTINATMIGDDRNKYKLPWYEGFTMGGAYKDFDVKAEMSKASGGADAYENGSSATMRYMDIDSAGVNMDMYSALWADKTKEGDKSSAIPGYKAEYHKSIEVKAPNGQVGCVAIADNRILVAIGPTVRALFFNEDFVGYDTSKKYEQGSNCRGIYVDVQLEDGTVVACITGDAKSSQDHWYFNNVIHEGVDAGCVEVITNNKGLSGDKINGYQVMFGSQKVKTLRVYTDDRCIENGTNKITYYFSDNLTDTANATSSPEPSSSPQATTTPSK